MEKIPTISYVVSNKLCTLCGVCEDVCPQSAIKFYRKNGTNTPIIDETKCINDKGCFRCFQLCSGIGLNLREMSRRLHTNSKHFDYYSGHYLNCYAGYSNNDHTRYHSASGGMISQFLVYLLKKGLIKGVFVTKFKNEAPTSPVTILATTEEEILSGKSSKYCPVTLNGIISKIKKLDGKYVIVGLPCHVQGFRKYEQNSPKFRKRVFGYFSTFCSSTRTFHGTDYILSRYNIDKNEIKFFSYRDDGCLGYLKAITEKNKIKIPFREYYPKMRSFFKPKRCLYCIDHFGDLADVSFGDIQTGKYKMDKIGINSIISRNPYFDGLLVEADKGGVITLNKIEFSTIYESQKTMLRHKRKLAGLNMHIERMIRNPTPKYDISLPRDYSLFDYLTYFVIKIQRQLGKYKLWFLIDFYNNAMSILERSKQR